MKPMALTAATAAMALLAAGCNSSRPQSEATPTVTELAPGRYATGESKIVPRAKAYRTSGDYRENVPIQLNAERTAVVSYPAPTDLSENSTPLQLCDGYLLDRRGIAANSVFTTYTYAQYMALDSAPTAAELLKSVIPGAVVTEIVEFPFSTSEAIADTARCNRLLSSGSKDCRVIYSVPTMK